MVSLNTTNTLVVYLGIVFFCLGGVSVLGFNDEAGTVKWSPKYLYEKVYSVPSSVPSKNKLIPSSLPVIYNAARPKNLMMNSRLNFYGLPGAGISTDWIRPRIANRFQLKKKHMYRKRTTCVEMGAPCLFRSGFYGAMRLNCCEGTSCENIGGNFLCVADNDYAAIEDDETEYGEPIEEEIYEDGIEKK